MQMEGYDHKKIEKKWREEWAKSGIFTAKDSVPGKENFYLLVEFPYPSGNLHVGHWYAFALPDILARYQRMKGKNVLYPIGFDAFGLPAENAAIKNKLNPRDWTEKNIEYMTKQIQSMGASFDWSREVRTIDPRYYKWTQWMFLQFFKKGLAYRKETAVNWCPNDKTVLANEQVVEGKCERCGHDVIQRQMLQWNLRITEYADRLIDDLDELDWPQQIKESQKHWIGRSEGAQIDFPVKFEAAEGKTPNFLILHGKGSTSQGNFYPWLKEQLEKRGYRVQAPDLPNPTDPSDEEQTVYVQKNCTIDEHTVIVGHSFGGIVALRLVEAGAKPAMVTLVGMPFTGHFMDGKERPTVLAACKKGFDGEKIKSATRVVALYDSKDHIVPVSDGESIAQITGGQLFAVEAQQPHFGSFVEPTVLQYADPTITVFTTRADTLCGATYLVLAPEHPWVTLALKHKTVLKNNDEVQKYVDAAGKKTELERIAQQKEKTGVKLEGVYAINPVNAEKIPLYVADYVLATYGTGAIMAVPAHDERDWEFAAKYDLPIRHVVAPRVVDETNPHKEGKELVFRKTVLGIVRDPKARKYLCLKWKQHPWTTFVIGGVEEGESWEDAARREIQEETGYTDLTLVKVLGGPIHTEFFAAHKDVNRVALGTSVLFEADSSAEVPSISPEEAEKHEVVWLPESEITRQKMQHAELDIVLRRAGEASDVYTGDGVLIDSAEFSGLSIEAGKRAITEKHGRAKKTYKLRDWIVSRQRYWGVPIPIIHCETCGPVAVPDDQLPVLLPEVEDYLPDGQGKSPLAKVQSFVDIQCPQCGAPAQRETDTLDTFVDSSWYFLRYTDPKNDREFAARGSQDNWLPVDLYSGGAEHTTMHLLYSRFWHKALFDLGLVADKEPYKRRMNRSLILGPDGQKMSKSRGNVIDPDEVVERLGADTVRMYLAFIGPYSEVSSYPWNPDGVVGIRRFIERVFRTQEWIVEDDVPELNAPLHKTIKKVGQDIEVLKFNTAIAQLMIMQNEIEKYKRIGKSQWGAFLRVLASFMPFASDELWYQSGHKTHLEDEEFPIADESMMHEDTLTIAVQINGKTRAQLDIPAEADKEYMEKAAHDAVAARLLGKKVMRAIVVPGRLVNFVIEP